MTLFESSPSSRTQEENKVTSPAGMAYRGLQQA